MKITKFTKEQVISLVQKYWGDVETITCNGIRYEFSKLFEAPSLDIGIKNKFICSFCGGDELDDVLKGFDENGDKYNGESR